MFISISTYIHTYVCTYLETVKHVLYISGITSKVSCYDVPANMFFECHSALSLRVCFNRNGITHSLYLCPSTDEAMHLYTYGVQCNPIHLLVLSGGFHS